MGLVEAKDYAEITYEAALEIVRREANRRSNYNPEGLHRLNCVEVFGENPHDMARRLRISDVLMFQYLNGKTKPLAKKLMHISVETGVSTTLLNLLFHHQKREFERYKGIVEGPAMIPEYLQQYFMPWTPRAAPNVTEKSKARDERRRSGNVNLDEVAQSEDGWIRKRYTGPLYSF
jgi:transcriptional regulator with XRE-family HTH domain